MKDTAQLRVENKKKIRGVLRDGKEYTKQEVAVRTGLSTATCNTLINEMDAEGEVTGRKLQLGEVGRSSQVYRINETYEYTLCVWFEMMDESRVLHLYLLNALGTVEEKKKEEFSFLDEPLLLTKIEEMMYTRENIAAIMVGTPSLLKEGKISHCDIPELDGCDLVGRLREKYSVLVHMENDMHYRVYGYYKKKCQPDQIVTLANFPLHVLPGMASVHRGEVINGKSDLAGMTGFLVFPFDREEQKKRLCPDQAMPLLVQMTVADIVLINPDIMICTGALVNEAVTEQLREECAHYLPKEHMPEFRCQEDTGEDYLAGMYEKAMELEEKWV